jgi:4-amino-4-deoxy-L-arabinose transferase-like glycosyltransferase
MDNGPASPQSAQPSRTAFATETKGGSHRQGQLTRAGFRIPGAADLILVLAVQAVLTIRLLRADTAFQDEAAYLWAGHLEWAHWLHGMAIPEFPAYFSGAPVIYPPLAAAADSIGGLVAARVLSLAFMLGATALAWNVARQLFGRRAAFFCAILFAISGPVLHLGSFATFDAMSLFLVALAAQFVVLAGVRQDATRLMIAAGVVLAIANATSYSTAVYDVVVVLLALFTAIPRPGAKLGAGRSLILLAVTAVLAMGGLLIGGSTYAHGVDVTTLERVSGSNSTSEILTDAWSWTGIVVVLAVIGVVMSWLSRERGARPWLLGLFTVAAFLAPAEQAGLHYVGSLNKHVGVGLWFAVMAAGYAVDRLIAAAPDGSARTVTCGACVVALAFPLALGARQSREFAMAWPDSTALVKILGPWLARTTGPILVEDPAPAEYYLHQESEWKRWSSTRNIVLYSGASTGGPSKAAGVVGQGDPAAFARFIAAGYFSLVALNFTDTTQLDHDIEADMKKSGSYHLVSLVPYGPDGGTYNIWRYEPRL